MHVRKVHSCGNDFCMISYEPLVDYSSLAIRMCNRRTGIGADGLIVLKTDPLEMLYYTSEGNRVLMNGNALRCAAKYADELGLSRRNKLEIITGNGIVPVEITKENPFTCQINLGKPNYNSSMIAVNDDLECFGRSILVDNHYVTIYSLFLGDIHTVVYVDSFNDNVIELAEKISNHKLFSKATNVDFVKIVNDSIIEVKTYERGIGFTLANGDGCAAATVVSQKLGYVKMKVKAKVELGQFICEITKKGTVLVSGSLEEVFSCEY